MRITVLARGGLAVYGGLYDPHANEAVVHVIDGESAPLVIAYPSAPSAPAKVEDGITSTAPTVQGNTLRATLSAMRDGGAVQFTATVAGAAKVVRIRASAETPTDAYSS